MDHPPLIGVDVGGTHVRVGVIREGRVGSEEREVSRLSQRLKALAREGAADTTAALGLVVGALVTAVRPVLDAHPDTVGVGFAVPGFFADARGRLLLAPNLPGLEDVDLKAPLEAALGVPVVVENDALAAAWGEWCLLPPKTGRPPSLLYAGLGTGVGGGLVLEGRPWRGAHGFGTELGHVRVERDGRRCGCGKRGCLEAYASATGVVRTWRALEGSGPALEADEIAARARRGDEHARAAFARAGEALGTGLAQVLTLLDVPEVVVGGGMAAAFDLLEPALRRRLDEDVLPVLEGRWRLRVSSAGDRAGMLGAALLARPPAEG